jgi:RNA polymerase sigma factor (sigma-70 family)
MNAQSRRSLEEENQFWKELYNFCLSLTGNAADAEDLAQESCVRIWEKRGLSIAEADLPYVKRVARNLHIDKYRRRGLHVVPMPEANDEIDEWRNLTDKRSLEEYESDRQREKEREQLRNLFEFLNKARQRISPNDMELIDRHIVDERSYKEIAKELNADTKEIAHRANLAKKKLVFWFRQYLRRHKNHDQK